MNFSGNNNDVSNQKMCKELLKLISVLRSYAIRALPRMYSHKDGLFVHQLVKIEGKIVKIGISHRYSSIVFIGLSKEPQNVIKSIFGENSLIEAYDRLHDHTNSLTNLGDIALALWAAISINYRNQEVIVKQLLREISEKKIFTVVELSWILDALCLFAESKHDDIIKSIADRIINSFNYKSGFFPHIIGKDQKSLRSHVSCFADLVYPIHALSNYYRYNSDLKALNAAKRCAEQICLLQGEGGQWWWHYDYRTGKIVEGYPVYSVHQDAMAPMALLALEEAGGGDFFESITRGMQWLEHADEINKTLIDTEYNCIWRKIGRDEPKKLSRYIQTAASKITHNLRIPTLDKLFPPTRIDYETRPYCMGWILYAWSEERVKRIQKLVELNDHT